MGILDVLFPKFCVSCKKFGSYLCPDCFSYLSFDFVSKCLVCERASIDGLTHPGCISKYNIDGVFTSLYYSTVAHKLLYNFKYKPYLSDLHTVLVDLLYEGIIQKELFTTLLNRPKVFMVPIPLHSNRQRRRGYNHAQLLAQGLSKKLSLPVEQSLIRVKNTHSQFSLDKKQRVENMKNAFGVRGDVQGKIIFLLDDLVTTGSTLKEAAKVLKRNGAKQVWGVTLFKG